MVSQRSPILSDRQGFDRRWFAPNLENVYLPVTGQDVADAWSAAITNGATPENLQITSGRHCYENWVYNPATRFIIDTTGIRDYGEDPTLGYYVGVGYGNWDLFRMMNNLYNKIIPAGSCYSVGLGGHITGGGYGLFSRQYGLSIDHLSAVDIVVKKNSSSSPELITVTAPSYPDLLWAVRGGGGGNFGVITRYYFDTLPTAPTKLYTNALTIPWSSLSDPTAFKEILANFADTANQGQGGPDPTWDILFANHHAAGSIVWAYYSFDVPNEGKTGSDYEALVNDRWRERKKQIQEIVKTSDEPGPIRGHPWHGDSSSIMSGNTESTVRNFTFLEGVQNANGSGPNRFGKYKSAYMKKAFTPTMGDALYTYLNSVPNADIDMSSSLVQIDSYGCKINTVAPTDTAIPQRSSIMKLQYQTYWNNSSIPGQDDPIQQQAHLDWINQTYSAVYQESGGYPDPARDPTNTVEGCYYNYCDNDLNDGGGVDFAMKLYFGNNISRLSTTKASYNAESWFKNVQSIPVK